MIATLRAPRGATLIELMVGLTLGLLVVLAASTVFIGSRQANRTTEGLSRVQETARNAFALIARDLRETGGNPCDSNVLVSNVLNNAQTTPPTWWVNWDRPLQGFDGGDAFDGAADGAAVGERVAGTDAVITKYIADLTDLTVTAHDAASARFSVNANPHRVQVGDLLMVCTYGQAAIFQASSIGADTIDHAESAAADGNGTDCLGLPIQCTTPPGYRFAPGSQIGRLTAVGWYIGNNGRADSGGRSLFRVTRNGPEEVAEGVSDMQIEYLRAGAAAYVDATAVANWNDVVGIRIALTLSGAQTAVSTTASGRLERPMSFTVYLRNRQP